MIKYEVQDRHARPFGRWGLTLPATPTAGPVRLEHGSATLTETKMGRMFRGEGVSGCWTAGISDCVVVAVAEYANGRWEGFWFEHCSGGLYEDFLKQVSTSGVHGDRCYALVAARDNIGTDTVGEDLSRRLGIPSNNVSIYVSHADFAFGVCLSGGTYGGAFGEVTQSGALMPEDHLW